MQTVIRAARTALQFCSRERDRVPVDVRETKVPLSHQTTFFANAIQDHSRCRIVIVFRALVPEIPLTSIREKVESRNVDDDALHFESIATERQSRPKENAKFPILLV